MKRILIVDDEKFIRLGIEALVRNSFDSVVIELAKNGQEAYEKLEADFYDVLITDINMPVMTGIELIRSIVQSKKDIKVIVLSGFNEFEYARQCLKYGVENYLLKPIDNKELIETLKEIFHWIDNRHTREKIDLIKELKYMIENKERSSEDIDKLLQNLHLNYNSYYMYYLKGSLGIKAFELEEDGTGEKGFMYISHNETEGYLISKSIIELSPNNFELIIDSGCQKNLLDSFKIIRELLRYSKILDKKYIQKKDIINRGYFFIEPNIINNIYDYIYMGKIDVIEELINNKIFPINHKENYDCYTYEEIHDNFIRGIFAKLDSNIANILSLNRAFKDLDFENIDMYISELKRVLEELSSKLNKNTKVEAMYIEKAKEYIEENYNKDINMATVSNYVSLNYSYFSCLFKKYMNVPFLDYLNMVRIEKSKKYLKEVDYKIYEISQLVGYKNPKHYSKLFKKIENITPVEYRLKCMERQEE